MEKRFFCWHRAGRCRVVRFLRSAVLVLSLWALLLSEYARGYCPRSIRRGLLWILGLDYGSKTVGVAVSDPLGITAQMAETIVREREDKLRRTLARIEALS